MWIEILQALNVVKPAPGHPPHRGMWIEMVIDLRNPMRSQSSSAYGVIIEACGGKAPRVPLGV